MTQKQLLDESVFRGHMIRVYHNPETDEVIVESNILDDPIKVDYDDRGWAIFGLKQYIKGWKAAGGN